MNIALKKTACLRRIL